MVMSSSMQDVFDKAAAAIGGAMDSAAGAVSGVAVESQPFMRGFVRMCSDGWLQGWHERNGGNASYRMTDAEVSTCRPYFDQQPGEWHDFGVRVDNMRGAHFVVTGAGCYLRNVELDCARNVGIVQIGDAGDAWRIVWGLKDGGRPTSELPSHVMNHSVRMAATDGACRVMYHAHPVSVIALTKVLPLDARAFTRALWKAMTECVMVFPQGVGVVDCMVPGGIEIARATSEVMKTYDAAIWAQHGLFASGPDFDATFGLMHAIDKAAKIHAQALMMNGGSDDFPNTIDEDMLRAIAQDLGLTLNEAFLD